MSGGCNDDDTSFLNICFSKKHNTVVMTADPEIEESEPSINKPKRPRDIQSFFEYLDVPYVQVDKVEASLVD